jgi:hypothetical protein
MGQQIPFHEVEIGEIFTLVPTGNQLKKMPRGWTNDGLGDAYNALFMGEQPSFHLIKDDLVVFVEKSTAQVVIGAKIAEIHHWEGFKAAIRFYDHTTGKDLEQSITFTTVDALVRFNTALLKVMKEQAEKPASKEYSGSVNEFLKHHRLVQCAGRIYHVAYTQHTQDGAIYEVKING